MVGHYSYPTFMSVLDLISIFLLAWYLLYMLNCISTLNGWVIKPRKVWGKQPLKPRKRLRSAEQPCGMRACPYSGGGFGVGTMFSPTVDQ